MDLAEIMITGLLAVAIAVVASAGTTQTCDTLTNESDKR